METAAAVFFYFALGWGLGIILTALAVIFTTPKTRQQALLRVQEIPEPECRCTCRNDLLVDSESICTYDDKVHYICSRCSRHSVWDFESEPPKRVAA